MIILFLIRFAQGVCPAYTCKPEEVFIPSSFCALYDESNFVPFYYIQSCQDPEKPFCAFETKTNSSCTFEPPAQFAFKYPGEKCTEDFECNLYSCEKQLCVGLGQSEACVSDFQCNPGLYCNNLTKFCTPLRTTSSVGCQTDFECSYESGCLVQGSLGTCTLYWSLPEGAEVNSCSSAGENFMCASGKCYKNKCIGYHKSEFVPIVCLNDRDCGSNRYTDQCQCGINRDANSFCILKGEDEPYKSYLAIMKEFSLSGWNSNCNTQRRFEYDCAADRWDRKQAELMRSYAFYIENFVNIVQHDDCSRAIFIPSYQDPVQIEYSCIVLPILGLWVL